MKYRVILYDAPYPTKVTRFNGTKLLFAQDGKWVNNPDVNQNVEIIIISDEELSYGDLSFSEKDKTFARFDSIFYLKDIANYRKVISSTTTKGYNNTADYTDDEIIKHIVDNNATEVELREVATIVSGGRPFFKYKLDKTPKKDPDIDFPGRPDFINNNLFTDSQALKIIIDVLNRVHRNEKLFLNPIAWAERYFGLDSKKITESNTIEAKAHYNKKLNDLVKIIEKWEDYCILERNKTNGKPSLSIKEWLKKYII